MPIIILTNGKATLYNDIIALADPRDLLNKLLMERGSILIVEQLVDERDFTKDPKVRVDPLHPIYEFRTWLDQDRRLAGMSAEEWKAKFPQSNQTSYRAGVWFASHEIQKKFESTINMVALEAREKQRIELAKVLDTLLKTPDPKTLPDEFRNRVISLVDDVLRDGHAIAPEGSPYA